MWVKLIVTKTLEINGKNTTYRPGDWVEVGRQAAMAMVAASEAVIANQTKMAELLPPGAHVLLTEDAPDTSPLMSKLNSTKLSVAIHNGGPIVLTHQYTLILSPAAAVKPDLLPLGFRLLEKWQMAVPVGDYHEMAIGIGTEQDRELTKSVIRDLRVPYYDTRLMFARRCADTIALFEAFECEKTAIEGGDARLAFLRAMYRVKPVLCALPTIWSKAE